MALEPLELNGKVAWVTGSSRGIGRVIASFLASQGADVAIHGTTPFSTQAFGEGSSLESVAKEIANTTEKIVFPTCGDLTEEATVGKIHSQIQENLGALDILVNCAGGHIGTAGTTGPMAG